MTQEIEPNPLVQRIVLLSALIKVAQAEFDKAKKEFGRQSTKGTTLTAWTADDVELGYVNKSKPNPKITGIDRDKLEDYILAVRADDLRSVVVLGEVSEIVPILKDAGREDLYWEEVTIPDWLMNEVKTQALKQPIPGITVSTPEGIVSAHAEAVAEQIVMQLLVPSLALNGAPVRVELEEE